MKILFIGYSNVLKNRVFPFLDQIQGIDTVCIAKYEHQDWDDKYKIINKPVELFDNYDIAIQQSKATLAYISTTNNSHYDWAKKTLEAGIHTVIDKPATILLNESLELLNIAKDKQLLLSEATVYAYHPQLEVINSIFEKERSIPKLITALFSFPPLDKGNFRYNKYLGGGAFLDTSPYAVSIGRFFFKDAPEQCFYSVNDADQDGLEISYSVLLKYSRNRSLIGHFGFNTEYVNRLNIIGDKVIIDVDRIFTIPDTFSNTIKVKANNHTYEVNVPCGNTFLIYLNRIIESIESNRLSLFYNDMHIDALSRDKIINNK
jgi:predicted dehydrogenase